MSGSSPQRVPESSVRRVAVWGAYAVLGATLIWSRLAHLGHSFWHDEIVMVADFVRPGPREILAGPDLSHELLALLAWLTSSLVGESEIAFRLLSAVPFVAGAVLVAWWLHARTEPLAGLLFLFLATVSPLLLDISRQARGYGLAFLAMAVVTVSALEAHRRGRRADVFALCVAGVVGTWTLPQFGIAWFTMAVALAASDRRVRQPTLVGGAASLVAIAAWYAPHLDQVRGAAQIEDGVQIGFPWVVTAPIDQVLLPALLWLDGTALVAGVVWLPVVLAAALVIGSSPLLRDRTSALVLTSGVIATVLVLWIAQAYVIPRYLSFLLVPLFILLASGGASILRRLTSRPAAVRSVVCLVAVALLAVRFVSIAPDVVRLPREAPRDAAEVIEGGESRTPVLAYMRNPVDLSFYLDRPVQVLSASDVSERVCGSTKPVFYVMQPFALPDVRVSCLDRPGVLAYRLPQYARGDEMDVWLVPPRS
jgi:hypothetical protein